MRFPRLSEILPVRLLVAITLLALLVGYFQNLSRVPIIPMGPVNPDMMGMVIRDPWYDFGTYPGAPDLPNYAAQDRMGAMLEQMGVRWVRIEFHIEASDAYSLTHVMRNDYFINEVAPRHNLKILGLLSFQLNRGMNAHDFSAPFVLTDPLYEHGLNEAMAIWLARARLIVNRYHANIAAYEVLNEPNRMGHDGEDAVPPRVLARLQMLFYHLVHQTDRHLPSDQTWRDSLHIILGGLQPAGRGSLDSKSHLSDLDYLRQVYASDDFQTYRTTYGSFPVDGVAYHPYPIEIHLGLLQTDSHYRATYEHDQAQEPDDSLMPVYHDLSLVLNQLDRIRTVLIEVGDPHTPLWITEIGYDVGRTRYGERNQAEFLRMIYRSLAARGDIAHIFWFKYEDFPSMIGPFREHWGSIAIPFVEHDACPGAACYDIEGRPMLLRPAFWMYREVAGMSNVTPEPPAQLLVDGTYIGMTNTDYTFTAHISRTTATPPFSYFWWTGLHETIIREGGMSDTATFSWAQPGTYHINVQASNEAGSIITQHTITIDAPTPTPTPTPSPTPLPTPTLILTATDVVTP